MSFQGQVGLQGVQGLTGASGEPGATGAIGATGARTINELVNGDANTGDWLALIDDAWTVTEPSLALIDYTQLPTGATGLSIGDLYILPEDDRLRYKYDAVDNRFISTWKTDNVGYGDNNTIALPMWSSGTFNFTVDWGDGSTGAVSSAGLVTHTYASPGTYEVIIDGVFDGIYLLQYESVASRKILEISNWGNAKPATNGAAFRAGVNLQITATDILDTSNVTSFAYFFSECWALTDVPNIGSWDTSNSTSFFRCFYTDTNFNASDLSGWDVSGASNFEACFYNCSSFNGDVSTWDVSSATNFHSTFFGCSIFDQDLSGWDVSSATSRFNMFAGVTLSTVNYDALLIAWSNLTLQSTGSFNAGSSKYSAGAPATARQSIIDNFSWTISDGGQV